MIQSVSNQTQQLINTSQNQNASHMYVGPYRLEKTLGKGQTGKEISKFMFYYLFSGKFPFEGES
jgi:hypothetical protein